MSFTGSQQHECSRLFELAMNLFWINRRLIINLCKATSIDAFLFEQIYVLQFENPSQKQRWIKIKITF